jgi:hypothetical protein
LELSKSKVTLIKYDYKENLDNFLSKINYVNLNEISKEMNLASFKRDLVIDEVLSDFELEFRYFVVDIDSVRVKWNYKVATQRGTEKLSVINNLISDLNLDKNFRLIFAFSDDSFQHSLINRCNLFIELFKEDIILKKSSYNVWST